MIRELPYKEPRFKYLNCTGMIGVIASTRDDVDNWYFNTCIQWQYIKNDARHKVPMITALDPYQLPPMVQSYYFNGFVMMYCLDELVHDLIDHGYYVNFWKIDDYFIKGKSNYSQRHFYHDGLVLGYDDEAQTYTFASYSSNRVFEKFVSPRNCVERAFNAAFTNAFCGIRIYEDFPEMQLDFSLILKGIREYLYPLKRPDRFLGIYLYDWLCEQVERHRDNDKHGLDQRLFRMVLEHKKCMMDRLQALANDGYIDCDCSDAYQPVYQQAVLLHYLCIKYNLTTQNRLLDAMVEKLHFISEREQQVLYRLLYHC